MQQLPLAPNPPGRLSVSNREIRQRFLPFVVFVLVLAATVTLGNRHQGRSSRVGEAEAIRSTLTAARPGVVIAVKADLLQRVKQGDVRAQVGPADLEAMTAELNSRVETLRAQ